MARQETSKVLIVGATSGIARALASAYAKAGAGVVLAGRDSDALEEDANDLRTRYNAEVRVQSFNALEPATYRGLVDGFDGSTAILCHGVLLNNDAAIADPDAHKRMIDVNYTSYALLLEQLADKMQKQGGGVIAALSSVAGDRGRASNYCYGATKAALSAYADGLRGRLSDTNVHIVTVKPGPVKTAMTRGMDGYEKMADPGKVARQIIRAIAKRQDIVYTPGKWRLIMAIIRAIPERVFKKLSI